MLCASIGTLSQFFPDIPMPLSFSSCTSPFPSGDRKSPVDVTPAFF
jgi:hypothetical protein